MAIKIKHEGNVTSRVYASAAGGKGKRQSEDARLLASMQSRGGGGGGTGGGARAGGSAPTMKASTSHAALGSAGSLISPRNTFEQQKELQTQKDDAAAARQKADQDWRSGEAEKASTARLQEQASEHLFRENEAEKERQARERTEITRLRRDEMQKQGYSVEQILQLEDLAENESSIVSDATLTQEEKDAAIAELRGRREAIKPMYGKSATPQEEYDASIVIDPVTKRRYRKNARGEFEQIEDAPQTRTAQEIWDSAFVAPDGTRYIVDSKGGLSPIANPNANSSARSAEASAEKRNAYILKRIGALRAEAEKDFAEGVDKPFDIDEAKNKAAAEYDAIYGAPMPAPNPQTVTSAGTSTVARPMTAEEARKKYLVGKKDDDKQF